MAVAHRPLEHGQGEAVDLQEDDSPAFGDLALARAPGDPLRHAQRVDVVVVRAEDRREDDAGRRGDHGDAQRRPERVDLHEAGRIGREQHQRVEDEHEHEAEQEHEREAEGRHERREHGVEDRDDGGGRDDGAEVLRRGAGDDKRPDQERDRADEPADGDAGEREPGPAGPPLTGCANVAALLLSRPAVSTSPPSCSSCPA